MKIKDIVALLINKQVGFELTQTKCHTYKVYYFPSLGIVWYKTIEGEYFLNGTLYQSFEEMVEDAKSLYGIGNIPCEIFVYTPEFDYGSFAVIGCESGDAEEKLLFCSSFTDNNKLVFMQFESSPLWDYTKLVKKELRAYHKKGIFVAQ